MLCRKFGWPSMKVLQIKESRLKLFGCSSKLVAMCNVLQSVKTKETNPTRPGSPTPCKQALSSLFSMFNNIRIPYSLNVLFPRDHERFKVPRIGVPHGTFPTGCAPLKYRLLIMGRTADRHALQFLHHLWICYLNTYQANRLTTRLSETQSLIAKRKIFLFALTEGYMSGVDNRLLYT